MRKEIKRESHEMKTIKEYSGVPFFPLIASFGKDYEYD